MANFQLTLLINGANCRARATFPNACYTVAGGRKGAPPGLSVPAGEYGYTCIYDYDGSQPCAQVETTLEWDLPYSEDTRGEYLTVWLMSSAGNVDDEKKTGVKVKEEL